MFMKKYSKNNLRLLNGVTDSFSSSFSHINKLTQKDNKKKDQVKIMKLHSLHFCYYTFLQQEQLNCASNVESDWTYF